MTRTNSLLVASLLVLALAVLARAAVISQHAYAVLHPAMSGDEPGLATAAVAAGQTKSLLATIDAEPAAPLASEQEVTAEIPVGERSQAKLDVPRQMDSEIHKRRQHHKLYNYRYSGGRFQAYWGPSVW
jgi:hypothetical protein